MKPTLTDAKFYGERKLKTEKRTSVDDCINSRIPRNLKNNARNNCKINTVNLLITQRKHKLRNPASELSLIQYLERLCNSSDKNRVALCKKWLAKINKYR